jgi:hypothetical protein
MSVGCEWVTFARKISRAVPKSKAEIRNLVVPASGTRSFWDLTLCGVLSTQRKTGSLANRGLLDSYVDLYELLRSVYVVRSQGDVRIKQIAANYRFRPTVDFTRKC